MSEPSGRLLSEFKVAELKAELDKRGLPTQGIKVGLVERMSKWMIENGLNPSTHLFEGSNSTPCSPSKSSAIDPVATPAATLPSTPSTTGEEKKAQEEVQSKEKSGTKEETQMEKEKEEVKQQEEKNMEDDKKKEDKQSEVPDAAKEKEMASRSIWIKNLKGGTKALEIKGMCMPIGHVVRAKMFTVKGKEATCGLTGLGYVTFSTGDEADLAVLRLDKTLLKGISVEVNKASPHNLPFLKPKKTPTASVSAVSSGTVAAATATSTASNGSSTVEKKKEEERKKEEKKKEEEKPKQKELSGKKEETAPIAASPAKEEPRRYDDEIQRPIVPPRFPTRVPATSSGRRSNDRGSDRKEDKEKGELARKLAEKDREHRKREEELKLQKEKERIRYEKEKVEKEKLRLQLEQLKAKMARGGGGGGRGEKRDERSERDEREKERIREREKEKERERDRDRKRERASYIAPATPQRPSREAYSSSRPWDRLRDDRDRKREAHHPSRNPPPVNYRDGGHKRRRPSPNRRDDRDIRTLSSSAFLPSTQGHSRPTYPSHVSGGSGWMGGNNYNTAATLNPWASSLPQYPQYQRRF